MHTIFSTVPWLKPFLEWSVAILIVLIVAALPAYFLFLPSAIRFRSAMARLLQRLREAHKSNLSDRQSRYESYLTQFTLDRLLRHLNASLHRFWMQTKSLISDRTAHLDKQVVSSKDAFEGFTRAIPRLQEGFAKNLESALPKEIEMPPISPELIAQTGNLIVARIMFVVALLGITVGVALNTGMLGQILRDLGFIPETYKIGGIHLYSVFAAFITCIESILGIVHAVLADSELSGRKPLSVPVGAWFAALGGIALACVEGMFYSKLIASRAETVTIPLFNFTIPQADLMFIWGFVLVMGLFGLGHICYSTGTKAIRGTAPTVLRRHVKSINRHMSKWTERLRAAEAALNKVRNAVLAANEASAQAPYTRLETLVSDLNNLVITVPQWATISNEPLDVSAVLQIARHALVWLVVTVGAAGIAVVTGYASFGFLGSRRLLIALALCCVFVIGGMLLAWHETIEDGESQKVMGPSWARLLGCILIGTSSVGYMLAFIHYGGSPLIWLGNLLVLVGVSAATYQLLPLVGLLPIWAHRLLMILMEALEFAIRVLVGIIYVISVILEEIISIIAKPMGMIFGRKQQPAALIVEPTKYTPSRESK